MTEHFNGLTPAEAERLAMLAEEAGEIVQMVGKILRHGYESYHPKDPEKRRNRVLLMNELIDMKAIIRLMEDEADTPAFPMRHSVVADKLARKMEYTHHQNDPKPTLRDV